MRRFASIALSLVLWISLSACQTPSAASSSSWSYEPTPAALGALAHAHCAVLEDGELIVWGGIMDDREVMWSDQLGSYRNGAWTLTAPGPSARSEAATVAAGRRFVVYGGIAPERQLLADFWLYEDGSWRALEGPNIPRRRASFTRVGDELVLYGGRSEGHEESLDSFSLTTLRWRSIALATRIESRVGHSALAVQGQLLIWGGMKGSERRGDGFLVDLSSGAVRSIPESESLSPRAQARAFTAKGGVYFWGGAPADQNSNSGAVYELASASWAALPSIPDPKFEQLKNAESLWIEGRGLLVWGGRFAEGGFNDEAYLFDLSAWKKLELKDKPPGRIAHCLLQQTANKVWLFGGLGETPGQNFSHFTGLWTLPLP